MCTIINLEKVEAQKKRLKRTKNIGWKIVSAIGGFYFAPMQDGHVYAKGKNVDIKVLCTRSIVYAKGNDIEVSQGVFHLFTTREVGRKILKEMKEQDSYSQ